MLSFIELTRRFTATAVQKEPAAAGKAKKYAFRKKTLQAYRAAMQDYGWLPAETVANRVGSDRWGASGVLKRLLKAGLVELDATPKNAYGRPLYLWRWKAAAEALKTP